MRMAGAFTGENASGAQESSNQDGAWTIPDGMFDVDDRLDQGNEAKIALEKAKQRPIPSAVACANYPELLAAERTQQSHELTQLGDALSESFAIPDEVCRDG